MATMESLLRAQENLAQYIANFYKNSTEKVRGDLQTASHFAARLELLESYWAKFTVNNDQLVCSEKDFASETYFANDGYGYIEAEYISAKARIRDLLATALPSGGPGEATPAGRSEIRIEQFSSLPSLALPKFSGKPSSPIQDFRCTTVTYGTASAPFLALRVMRQLAEDGRETHPEAAEALHHQLYVDDVFFGADSLEQALVRRDEIIDLLVSAGMRLGKWAASDPKLIDGLVSTSEDVEPLNVDEIVSTLGLKWLPGRDIFTFQFAARPTQVEITKRSILAEIARTFDPLGWLSPVLVPAKVLLQDLCLDGVDWDAPISATLEQRWTDFTAALPEVSCIRIKRWLSTREGEDWHLHGFADASKRAYATAIYVVLPGRASHLIVAKTKLAPTGVQTVPRLELCAAVLLARLARHLIDKLRFPPRKVYCWSDSKVVLDWIASHPSRWPTFVANRVSEVQTRLPGAHWNHVRTMDNSADCATRGLTPPELAKFSLWWYGPSWLIEEETSWPRLTEPGEVTASTAAVESTARPTIDAEDVRGLLRVGGRLHHAQLSYNEKHPVILPGDCMFVRRMIETVHRELLHGGPQLMRSHLSRSVWIARGVHVIRGVCQRCVRCARYKAAAISQQMAPLPAVRVTPGRPFSITGVDYAGPLPVLFSKGKGARATKGYISIFICMVTRAVHVEVVSDLTAAAFLAAFSRFCSRRGLPSVMYSDNGTTFKGASKELMALFKQDSRFRAGVGRALAMRGTRWSFIPPRAPHFGGLWEAAVRSFKHHLKRVIGKSRLTYEELSTLAARIEACLNSRPLCPMSGDPDDLAALTPAHFLTGSSLLDYPEPYNPKEKPMYFTSRWRLLRNMRDMFWTRWRREVLNQLQQRSRWLDSRSNLQEGDMVLIRDELSPPSEWPLGRVTKTHPGSDGLVRVATIRTAQATFTRPVVKLTRLPTDKEAESYYATRQRQ
ncbi:unnamed protein product [Trichogramma brassicae]|uniref:Integrase catalytic domain-containing protein n=1 Tax=Trichogramma brassicae TaxID=86971 RepID=A0A6H5J1E1_9HYME|nr:unnamed protein product [Trichogramma brassicae]